jgi:hypothetical protein
MTAEEAIKYLGFIYDYLKDNGVIDELPSEQAIKLGIEALKRIGVAREHAGYMGSSLLPGETQS